MSGVEVLKSFAEKLLVAAMETYRRFLSSSSTDTKLDFSEKGILQLIFDVQFIGEVLIGKVSFL